MKDLIPFEKGDEFFEIKIFGKDCRAVMRDDRVFVCLADAVKAMGLDRSNATRFANTLPDGEKLLVKLTTSFGVKPHVFIGKHSIIRMGLRSDLADAVKLQYEAAEILDQVERYGIYIKPGIDPQKAIAACAIEQYARNRGWGRTLPQVIETGRRHKLIGPEVYVFHERGMRFKNGTGSTLARLAKARTWVEETTLFAIVPGDVAEETEWHQRLSQFRIGEKEQFDIPDKETLIWIKFAERRSHKTLNDVFARLGLIYPVQLLFPWGAP